MGNTTLTDVFNAGAGMASSIFQREAVRLRERNDEALRYIEEGAAIKFADYLRDHQYNPSGDPQKYFETYRGQMRDAIEQEYGVYLETNSSPYFKKQLDQMRLRYLNAADNAVLVRQDEWQTQQNEVEYANRQNRINNVEWTDISKKLEAKLEAHDFHMNRQGANPITRANDLAKIYNDMFDGALAIDIGNLTVNEAHDLIKRRIEEVETAVNAREEGALDKWIENKQRRIDVALGAAREAIWKRRYNSLNTLNTEYQRIARDAVRSDSYSLRMEAWKLWQEGSGLREEAINSPDYDPDDFDKIAAMFPVISGLFGDKSGSSAGDKVKEIITDMRDNLIRKTVEDSLAFGETREIFVNSMGELAARLGMVDERGRGDINALEQQYSEEMNFIGMWDEVRDMLIKIDPGYADAFAGVDTYMKGFAEKAKDKPEEKALREYQGKLVAGYMFDLIMDASGPARPSPVQVQQEGMRVASLLVGGDIAFVKQTADNSSRYEGGNSDENFRMAIYEISQHPWARYNVHNKMSGSTAYTFGDTQYMKDLENKALDNFSVITRIPLANLNISGHVKEGKYDETAEFTIQVIGMGDKNGTFKFAADENKYWIERQTDEGWEIAEEYKKTAGEAQKELSWQLMEQHGEELKAAERANEQQGAQRIFNLIRNEDDPGKRRQLGESLRYPPAGTTPVPDIEFWKAGINPDNMSSVREIPAEIYDQILDGLTPQQIQQWIRTTRLTRGGR